MRPEERAATLKFYDILQERVKTYVEGAPQDLFYYHDKNSGSWGRPIGLCFRCND